MDRSKKWLTLLNLDTQNYLITIREWLNMDKLFYFLCGSKLVNLNKNMVTSWIKKIQKWK
jgi:hypothetical protein